MSKRSPRLLFAYTQLKMGCAGSICASAASPSFYYTSLPQIDRVYKDVRRLVSLMRKESAHLEVAYDTFITVSGTFAHPAAQKVGLGLVAVLVAVLEELKLTPPLALGTHFPGLLVDEDRLKTAEVARAWGVWVKLAAETRITLDYLQANLLRALDCASSPNKIKEMISQLGQSPDIRLIDIRKLEKITASNSAILLEAAENFHRTIQRIRDIACSSIAVLTALAGALDLQRRLQALSVRAERAGWRDPAEIVREMKEELLDFLDLCTKQSEF